MPRWCNLKIIALVFSGLAILFTPMRATAQTSPLLSLALKSGESIDVQDLYYVVNCKSLLTGPITVEILDGPQEVSVSVREKRIMPRRQGCSRFVQGGTLVLSAKDIEDPSTTRLTVRVTFDTKDGQHKIALEYNLTLVP